MLNMMILYLKPWHDSFNWLCSNVADLHILQFLSDWETWTTHDAAYLFADVSEADSAAVQDTDKYEDTPQKPVSGSVAAPNRL